MTRHDMIERIGNAYMTSNIEGGEYSYIQEAGSRANLENALGRNISHFKLDIRFEKDDTVVLVETKQSFKKSDEDQLSEYLQQERVLHYGKKIIAILANTNNDDIKVWKSAVDDDHVLSNETVLDKIEHYVSLFNASKQNDREKVLKNTYDLNELLHKMDIDERLRSQFVGTTLLYLKKLVEKFGAKKIDEKLKKTLDDHWSMMDGKQLRAAIESTLDSLLDGSDNKAKKIELLQKNVLNDQKVKKLTITHWIKILDTILMDIYRYIDTDSSEGQDILNMFFIAFNKYTGKADKNQAFTPDHITEFMCRVTGVDRTKRVLDATCGSGSFLVQAMVKELADCKRGKREDEANDLIRKVKEEHIYGIEVEEKAYGLSTTNMLIHGDGNSNIKFGSCFDLKGFIKDADPDIILMNPPYNAKPIGIPAKYKASWGNSKNGKEDPTKGFVFVHYLSDVIKETNDKREKDGKPRKMVKMAVLLPVAAAIGTKAIIQNEKISMLKNNTLEAVFTLPNEIFYPGASASACCMVFTLGEPHIKADGTMKETFFGYYKEDGFKKKKNLGRVEQFDNDGNSKWKAIEEEWLKLFRNHKSVDGLSATAEVSGTDEWLCEAYMKTDYTKLCEEDFQQTLNNYLAYLMKEGKIYES
jgi:type I restriction enzyme M protein